MTQTMINYEIELKQYLVKNPEEFLQLITNSLDNLVAYSEKYKQLNEFKKTAEKEKENLSKAISLLKLLAKNEILMDNETAKKRYEEEDNIYSSKFMVEAKLTDLNIPDKNGLITVALCNTDICALNKNPNRLLAIASSSPFLMEMVRELGIEAKEPDLFDIFVAMTDKDRMNFLNENLEFSHIAVQSEDINFAVTLKGRVDKYPMLSAEFLDFTKDKSEELEKAFDDLIESEINTNIKDTIRQNKNNALRTYKSLLKTA